MMQVAREDFTTIRNALARSSGENPPFRVLYGLATFLEEDFSDLSVVARHTNDGEMERWQVIALCGDLLVTVEAENPNPDWADGFDADKGSFIHGRAMAIAEVLALESIATTSDQWERTSWQPTFRIALRDGTKLSLPQRGTSESQDAHTDFGLAVRRKLSELQR